MTTYWPDYYKEFHCKAGECLHTCCAGWVICIDDESTDGSVAVIREYVAKDSRVSLILSQHRNAGAARNIGYRASKGKYLLFLDADDVFAPTMIETLRGAMLKYDVDIANCDKRDFMSGRPLPELATGNVANFKVLDNSKKRVNCFKEFVGWSWDKLFKREMAEEYGLFFQEQQAHNDFFFCNCMCCLANRIAKTSAVFIAHRKHETSIAVNRDKSPLCFSSALRAFYGKMDELGFWKTYPDQLRFYNNYVVELGFWTIDTLKQAESIKLAYAELRRILAEQGALNKDKWYMNIYPQWFAKYQCLCRHEDVLLFWRDAALAERNAVKWWQKRCTAANAELAQVNNELAELKRKIEMQREAVHAERKMPIDCDILL